MPSGHAVFDGSNIATEGRSEPSLAQLREAVSAFTDEYDFEIVTVIVDASFEHRVAKGERKAARAAIDANEMITPPAGVIGRGDTFILQVAHRAEAVVVSNDSFQEFHGTYSWLFDEGRLIGGKPIPALGWVFVPRAPVKGPISRRARAQATDDTATSKTPAKQTTKKASKKTAKPATKQATKKSAKKPRKPAPAASAVADVPGANPVEVWKAFRRQHPPGSAITATVESFSSHGAYARSGDASIYLPLRLLAEPAPRRARDAVTVGEARDFIVHRFDEQRRGIDAGIVPFDASSGQTEASTHQSDLKTPTKGRIVAAKKAAKKATKKSAKKAPAKKAGAKKAAKKAPAKKAAKKRPAKKAGTKKATKKAAKKSAKKSAAKKATKKSAKKAAKKRPAKKAGAKKAAKKAAKKSAKKSAAKKAAKKSAKKSAAKKATKKSAKKAAKKRPAKKAAKKRR